ncbi:MAG TPA: histidine phosphatase family protein [Stellaceae bacterium]|jgi:phosphohistidine phosphatase|nr:histidine phosphatase family protein [Stellaceae bacterium]
MHQLHLLRHAKSSWDDDADDHARPLNKRGREGARLIGDSLPRAINHLDLVLCSSALRTRETAELVLAGFSPGPKILYEDDLYLATEATLMQRLHELDETSDVVMVIGHNPGLHELAVGLAAPGSAGFSTLANGKFPTGVRCRFVIGTPWAAVGSTRHRLVDYVTVKSLGGND